MKRVDVRWWLFWAAIIFLFSVSMTLVDSLNHPGARLAGRQLDVLIAWTFGLDVAVLAVWGFLKLTNREK